MSATPIVNPLPKIFLRYSPEYTSQTKISNFVVTGYYYDNNVPACFI